MISETDENNIQKHMEGIKNWCKDPEKILEYERSIREAIIQNRIDDELLKTSSYVSDTLWKGFIDADIYGNITTVTWAAKKIAILYRRTLAGEKISIPKLKINLDKENFKEIIFREFSEFMYDEVLKHYEYGNEIS